MSKIIQINTNKSRGSLDLAIDLANKLRCNFICITEPPKLYNDKLTGIPGWEHSCNQHSAIIYRKTLINIVPVPLRATYTTAIKIGDIVLSSTYASPNMSTDEPFDEMAAISRKYTKVVLTGDMNCRLLPSGLPIRTRDLDFHDLINNNGLNVENSKEPTLLHQGRATINDYTLTKSCRILKWKVLSEEISLSDHYFISFTLETTPIENKNPISRKLNEVDFLERVVNCTLPSMKAANEEEVHNLGLMLTEWTSKNVEECTTERIIKPNSHWWNGELEAMKIFIKKLRRKRHRSKNEEEIRSLSRIIKEEQTKLRNGMKKSKINNWREFIGQTEPWGKPYKVIIKSREKVDVHPHIQKDDGSVTTNRKDAMKYLLHVKIPATAPPLLMNQRTVTTKEVLPPEITEEEIATILKKCKNKSAPGFDSVGYKPLKILNKRHPDLLKDLYNSCMIHGTFPDTWKTGKLIWLLKAGKDNKTTGAYRPLTLLSVLGKTLERIICARISDTITLSENQYGFRKGRGTEDCLHRVLEEVKNRRTRYNFTAMVSLDISGAFDHISWPHAVSELTLKGVNKHLIRIVENYCTDRYVQDIEGNKKKLVCGCPQGSVVAPLLWNVGYDCVIKELTEKGYTAYVYADDTMIIVSDNSKNSLVTKIEEAMKTAEVKMNEMNLSLNMKKTEIVILGSVITSTPPTITIKCGGQEVRSKSSMKYLGLMIDSRLSWDEHIQYLEEKSQILLPKLISLCQNTFGYSAEARKTMLKGTIGAFFGYSSTVYIGSLMEKTKQDRIRRIHQKMATCIGRLYRTSSYLGACAIIGQPPMVLDLLGRAILKSLKKGWTPFWGLFHRPTNNEDILQHLDNEVLRIWQKWWTDYKESVWTKELIPTVGVNTPEIDFYLGQALTGHGCFRSYRKRIRKIEDGNCPDCNIEETAEHVLKTCHRFSNGRPAELNFHDEESRRYMTKTVQALWQIEQAEDRKKIEVRNRATPFGNSRRP